MSHGPHGPLFPLHLNQLSNLPIIEYLLYVMYFLTIIHNHYINLQGRYCDQRLTDEEDEPQEIHFPKIIQLRQVSNNAQYSSKIYTISIQSLGYCVLDAHKHWSPSFHCVGTEKRLAGWRTRTSLLSGEHDYLRFFKHAFGKSFFAWLIIAF